MRFVILGMHKSGTTLVSQLLHKGGINMGDFDLTKGYDDGNQYERSETQVINLELLRRPSRPSYAAVQGDFRPTPEILQKGISLINENDHKHEDWGFKDPRTCLTYSFWCKSLDEHKVIFIFRDPVEVWLRYTSGNLLTKIGKIATRGLPVLRAWFEYNQCVLKQIDHEDENVLVVEYSDLMSDERQMRGLSAFAGVNIVDHRDRTKYRNRSTNKPLSYRLFVHLHATLFGRDIDALLDDARKKRTIMSQSKRK